MTVYPNPSNDYLKVSLNENSSGGNLKISETSGRVIVTDYLEKGKTTWENNLSFCDAGIYYIQFQSKEGWSTLKKWIKL